MFLLALFFIFFGIPSEAFQTGHTPNKESLKSFEPCRANKSGMLSHVGKLLGTMGTSTLTDRPPIMETNGQRGSWAKLGTLKRMICESIKTRSQSCDGVIGHRDRKLPTWRPISCCLQPFLRVVCFRKPGGSCTPGFGELRRNKMPPT